MGSWGAGEVVWFDLAILLGSKTFLPIPLLLCFVTGGYSPKICHPLMADLFHQKFLRRRASSGDPAAHEKTPTAGSSGSPHSFCMASICASSKTCALRFLAVYWLVEALVAATPGAFSSAQQYEFWVVWDSLPKGEKEYESTTQLGVGRLTNHQECPNKSYALRRWPPTTWPGVILEVLISSQMFFCRGTWHKAAPSCICSNKPWSF